MQADTEGWFFGLEERYEREVLDHLRLLLIEGGEETPLGYTKYRLLAEEVRGEAREGEKTVVVLFRLRGDQRRFGFRIGLLEAGDPSIGNPISAADTILALLDEAILVGPRSRPDPEGIIWVDC